MKIDWHVLLRRFPYKIIGGDCVAQKGPMMIRWMILRWKYFGLYVHLFLRSDIDRACHDHPWSFISIPVSAGYREHTERTVITRRRFVPVFRRAEWRHWVEVQKPVWTICIRFRRRREWGFWTSRGFIHWEAFDYERCPD